MRGEIQLKVKVKNIFLEVFQNTLKASLNNWKVSIGSLRKVITRVSVDWKIKQPKFDPILGGWIFFGDDLVYVQKFLTLNDPSQ